MSTTNVMEPETGDQIMKRWQTFFKMVGGEISEEMKRLYAIGKLTQVVLIQYLARRNAYPESCFMKRTYVDLEFFTLDAKDEKGAKLDEIIRTAGTFINNQCLKTFRFQIFTDSERPNLISEEVQFEFFYGEGMKNVTTIMGNGDRLVLDFGDCSFEKFVANFRKSMDMMQAYCEQLAPIPRWCEKRFRTSFCKKVPDGFDKNLFIEARNGFEYAPDIFTTGFGDAALPGVAVVSTLRSRYLNSEIYNRVTGKTRQAPAIRAAEKTPRAPSIQFTEETPRLPVRHIVRESVPGAQAPAGGVDLFNLDESDQDEYQAPIGNVDLFNSADNEQNVVTEPAVEHVRAASVRERSSSIEIYENANVRAPPLVAEEELLPASNAVSPHTAIERQSSIPADRQSLISFEAFVSPRTEHMPPSVAQRRLSPGGLDNSLRDNNAIEGQTVRKERLMSKEIRLSPYGSPVHEESSETSEEEEDQRGPGRKSRKRQAAQVEKQKAKRDRK